VRLSTYLNEVTPNPAKGQWQICVEIKTKTKQITKDNA